jgi:hypothetical protein
MKTIMNANKLDTIEQLIKFLDGTQAVAFSVEGDKKTNMYGYSTLWYNLII